MAPKPENLKRPGLRERKKQQTRQDLLAVAETLFAKNEFDGVTVEQIAEMANISHKTFFNYFQNKAQFLSEYLHDWLMTIGFWSFPDTPIVDCRSAIVPTDAYDQLKWIIEHRRIFRMAVKETDFFDFIYNLDEESEQFDAELYAAIREPRKARVAQAQAQGLIRDDISPADVCRQYDALRINAVRRWLSTSDQDAAPELIHEWFDTYVDSLIRGIEARS